MNRAVKILAAALCLLAFATGSFAAVRDTLVVANVADAKTLDPQANSDLLTTVILKQIFDTLLALDNDGRLMPCLAESFDVEDNQFFTFHLRKGVKFHDGTELKASDIKFSILRCITKEMTNYVTANVDPEGIEIIDDYTVRIRTKVPDTSFPYYMAGPNGAGIVSEKAISAPDADPDMKPVGTGPYKFESWQKGSRINLVRNDDYWGEKAKTPNLVIRVITEPANRTIDLETGLIDISLAVQYIDIEQIANDPKLQMLRIPRPLYTFIGLNTKLKPFDDPRVRQALYMALDLEQLVQVVYRGVGIPSPSIIPPRLAYYDETQPKHEYNPEKARQLLAEAGYPDGFKAFFGVSDRKERVDTAQVAQFMWKENLGVDVEIQVMEQGAFIDYARSDACSIHMASWSNPTSEPVSSVAGVLELTAPNNYSRFDDPLYNELIVKSRMTQDGPERAEIFKQLQKRYREMLPILLTWTGEDVIGLRANVKGFEPAPIYDLSKVYVED